MLKRCACRVDRKPWEPVCPGCRLAITLYALAHTTELAVEASGVSRRTIESWRRKRRERVGPWAA